MCYEINDLFDIAYYPNLLASSVSTESRRAVSVDLFAWLHYCYLKQVNGKPIIMFSDTERRMSVSFRMLLDPC